MSVSIDIEPHVGEVDWEEVPQGQGLPGAVSDETPACQLCRKKKAKCSRQQPCSQCLKSGADCVYEDKRSKGGVKIGVIERLTQRIDIIENMFLGQSVLMQQLIKGQNAVKASSFLQSFTSTDFTTSTEKLKRALLDVVAATKVADAGNYAETSELSPSRRKRAYKEDLKVSGDRPPKRTCVSTSTSYATPQLAPVETILEVYFKFIHPWIPVLHPATFLRRARELDRPPGIVLVLKAITAMALPYAGVSAETCRPEELDNHLSQLRQSVVISAIESSSKEAIQALILVTFDTIKRGLSRSPWSLVSVICRKIEGLQLNAEEKRENHHLATFFSQPTEPLDPPTAWVEVEERRRVFWGAFLLDRFCSIATGSNPNISSKSIQRRLPCDGCMWELDQCVETSFFKIHEQTQDSLDSSADAEDAPFPPVYNDSQGPTGIGGLAYTIEATESLYLVSKFHERHPLEPDSASQLSGWLHKFRQLDSRLLQWELCLTHRWREVRVVDGYIDPNLTIAHMTHNAAIITLHSRLACPPRQARAWLSSLVSGASKEACVMAAMKIDRIARRFLEASSGIPPHQFVLCMYIAGKVLLQWNTTRVSETATSLVALLLEVSSRISVLKEGEMQNLNAEDPAMRLRKALIAQRESTEEIGVRNVALATVPGMESTAPNEQPLMNMVDFSSMLHPFSTSPSSGGSVFGMNFLDQESPLEFDRGLLTGGQPALQNSSTQDDQLEKGAAEPAAEDEMDFDFMAELRKLESRARAQGRRQRGQVEQSQPK
ncbi:Transcription factor [Beauveria brongniartii RCEF 3172]|uniref:Transcription factor n=1 Tax=Beauveria brongniartii RCEF 3172 TaxID=1081107 RepID=A0A167A338_9HYPO|nr:Transcription factor [Beauveria brongniartii RCEF 3172]